jgi:parallel beta-helix repeat protein
MYYVSKGGSNAHVCSKATSIKTPKLTIANGLACLKPGDTLLIRGGVYSESINYNQIVSGRSSSSRTTIKGADGEIVTLRPNQGGLAGDVVWFQNNHFVTLESLTLDASHVSVLGIRVQRSTSLILRNLIVNNALRNSCIGSGGDSIHILNSTIHDCGHHGIYLQGDNNIVSGNEIYNNAGHGVHQYNNHSYPDNNNVISHNHIHDNDSTGILIGSGSNNLAHHNLVRNNGMMTTAGGIRVAYHAARNGQVYNNTIYANTGVCISIGSGSVSAKIKNNLCLRNTSNKILNSGTNSVIDNNRVSSDISLVENPNTDHFFPQDGSPLIDAGEIIPGFSEGTFLGSAPDQGALEFEP